MSVYIKGMEMPKEGDLIVIRPDGKAYYVSANPQNAYEGEAVPVPPHGRLIDADALLESEQGYTIPNYNSDGYVADLEGAYTEVQIENAPTIIPADKEGEG